MSWSAGAGVFLKFSRLFVRIHRWALIKMSMNCKLSGTNGRLLAFFKLKKAKEHVHGPNGVRKWRRKLLFLWILGVTIGTIWFLLSFDGGAWGRSEKISKSCEGKARILLEHLNVSRNQLHALASLFSESDQITSLKCTKEPGAEMPFDGITCALKVLCSEKQDLERQHIWVAENVEPKDQCPVQDENIPRKLDLSVLEDSSVTLGLHSTISSLSIRDENCEKDILGTRTLGDRARDHCENLSFWLMKGCWWVLFGMIVSFKVFGFRLKFRRDRKQKLSKLQPVAQKHSLLVQQKQQQQAQSPTRGAGKWRKKLLVIFVLLGIIMSIWLFWHLNEKIALRREETLANMCDERARMLQDQFNVSMNHVHALAILVSTFHHGKNPSAVDQKTFGEYTERTSFERPLTSGVAYASKVLHSEREQFEKQHGRTVKKMETKDQTSKIVHQKTWILHPFKMNNGL